MATIDKLPAGRWRARVRRRGAATQTRTFERRFDAEGWARKVEGEIERGEWRDLGNADRMTLVEALDRYATEIVPGHRGATAELAHIRVIRDERLMRGTLSATSRSAIQKMRDAWTEDGLAVATVNRRLTILYAVFEAARVEWEMAGLANPVTKVKLSGATQRERRVKAVEVEALIAASSSPFLPALIRLAIETAMRRGEWAKLTWAMIKTHKRTIKLPGGQGVTKNDRARNVPLSRAAMAELDKLPRKGSRVFPVTAHAISVAFSRARERARAAHFAAVAAGEVKAIKGFLENVTFHDLRHEAASRLAERLDPREWVKVVGHSDFKTTIRYYHPDANEIAKKLD